MTVLAGIVILLGCSLIAETVILMLYRKKYHHKTNDAIAAGNREDLSEPQQSTQQLQMSKAELELVFDAIPEQVCILDRELTIVRANRSLADFLHLQIREVLGKKCYQLFWGRACSCEGCPVKGTFEQKSPVNKQQYTRTIDQAVRFFEVSAFPVFDRDGEVRHVIEFTKDTTEERRMTDHLIRSEKLASIGRMTSGIAHEMNNPLSGISGNAANLLKMPEKYGLNEKGISRVTAILNSAAHATAIMDDLLHLSQRPEQSTVLVNINALLVKTANAVHIDGSQDIERRFIIDDKLPPLNCDPSKIQQVIVHVVTNAIQAIIDRKNSLNDNEPYRGTLIIATQSSNNKVHITFTDNGIGIREEHRSKIFDPFFSTRPTGQGTGLGLSVSYKIIEEHRGKMFFECVDNLTRFSIMLPLERSHIAATETNH